MFPLYVNIDTTTTSFLRHIQEDRSLNIHCLENLKFHTLLTKLYSLHQLYHSPMRKIFSTEANVTSPGCGEFVGQGKKTAYKYCNER